MIRDQQFAGGQIMGARPYQEDSFAWLNASPRSDRPSGLAVVLADGMGGHAGGREASSLAVNAFIGTFKGARGSILQRLSDGLEQANGAVGRRVEQNRALAGMGCTLVGVALTDVGLEWVSVGDSLLLLYRDGRLKRLNADHSMAPVLAQRVRAGQMSAVEARRDPHRNALRSAVVGAELSLIDYSRAPVPLQPGDLLILASDGLMTLSDDDIVSICRATEGKPAKETVDQLLQAVDMRQRRNQDNTTVVVVVPAMVPANDTEPSPGPAVDQDQAEADDRPPAREGLDPWLWAGIVTLGLLVLIGAVSFGVFLFFWALFGDSDPPAPAEPAPVSTGEAPAAPPPATDDPAAPPQEPAGSTPKGAQGDAGDAASGTATVPEPAPEVSVPDQETDAEAPAPPGAAPGQDDEAAGEAAAEPVSPAESPEDGGGGA